MEDPLASVSECGEPTSSQKEKLRTCPFARGSEIYPDLSDSLSASATPPQSESTAIQMVSLPDSVSAENEDANGVRENDFNDSELFKGSKRIRFPEEDLGVDSPTLYVGETEPTAIEIIGDESVNPDGIDLECEEVAREKEKKMVNLDSSVNVVVGYSRAVCENGNSKGIEEEKHDSANTKKKCRRELPLSIKGGGNEETRRRVDAKNLTPFKDIMVGLEALLGKADDGRKPESLLETAEKCGWVFPKPRWWPPEGFDD
nr:Titin like [Ipomoea batatas]